MFTLFVVEATHTYINNNKLSIEVSLFFNFNRLIYSFCTVLFWSQFFRSLPSIMGCFGSRPTRTEPTAVRGCTDVCWLAIYVIFWVFMVSPEKIFASGDGEWLSFAVTLPSSISGR